jgi:hypothetical protein
LVSVHDRTWTTDRATAAARWAQIEPSAAAGLSQLLEWAESAPGTTRDDVGRALAETVQPIVDSFAATIGLWS